MISTENEYRISTGVHRHLQEASRVRDYKESSNITATSSRCFLSSTSGVVRVDKETSKLCIIFDGSARDHNSCSLNNCLRKGLRVYLTGLTADIEKAFHQIAVDPRDRDMLRFLWFDNMQKEHLNIIYTVSFLPFSVWWANPKPCHFEFSTYASFDPKNESKISC